MRANVHRKAPERCFCYYIRENREICLQTFEKRVIQLMQKMNGKSEVTYEKSGIIFDIDGTILSEKTKEIPKSAIEALLAAQKKDIFYLSIQGELCADSGTVKAVHV